MIASLLVTVMYAQNNHTTSMDIDVERRDSLIKYGAYEQGIELSNLLYSKFDQQGEYTKALTSLIVSSEGFLRIGLPSKADSVLEFVEKSAGERLNNPSIIYDLLFKGKGASHLFKREYDSAMIDLEKAAYFFELKNGNEKKVLSQIFSYIGSCHFNLGDLDSTVHYFEKAYNIDRRDYIEQKKDTIDQHFLGQLMRLATLYYYKGNYLKYISRFKKALTIKEKISKPDGLLYLNYGYGLMLFGAVEDAIEYMDKGLQIMAEEGLLYTPDYVNKIFIFVESYCLINEFEKADSLMHLFEAKAAQIETTPDIDGYAMFCKGFILYEQQKFAQAAPLFKQTIQILEAQGNLTQLLGSAYTNLIKCLFETGATGEALAIYQKGEDIVSKVYGINSRHWFLIKNSLIQQYIRTGNRQEAIKR
ncbi:MAG: hypothetical protein AAFN93_23895, partial [Bacteroidota bacterium]